MSALRNWRDDWRYHRARKRLSRVSPIQVRAWADSTLWATQQALEAGQYEEARIGAIGLLAATDVLLDKDPASMSS